MIEALSTRTIVLTIGPQSRWSLFDTWSSTLIDSMSGSVIVGTQFTWPSATGRSLNYATVPHRFEITASARYQLIARDIYGLRNS
jgi:hypothetical protein